MLYEIKTAKKYDNDIPVKYFADEYFDLTTWFDENNNIISFQLTHDKFHRPHALTWREEHGYMHNKIDEGERPGRFKQSPILLPDGIFPKKDVARRFEEASRNIDRSIAVFVLSKLLEA